MLRMTMLVCSLVFVLCVYNKDINLSPVCRCDAGHRAHLLIPQTHTLYTVMSPGCRDYLQPENTPTSSHTLLGQIARVASYLYNMSTDIE